MIAMYIVRRADDGLAVISLRVHPAAIRTAHLAAGIPLDLCHPCQATPTNPGALHNARYGRP
jgi:hypothetical protein